MINPQVLVLTDVYLKVLGCLFDRYKTKKLAVKLLKEFIPILFTTPVHLITIDTYLCIKSSTFICIKYIHVFNLEHYITAIIKYKIFKLECPLNHMVL